MMKKILPIIKEDDDNYYVYAFLPQLKKDQIKVKYNKKRILTIAGEKSDEKCKTKCSNKKENTCKHKSTKKCKHGKFEKTIKIPDNATLKDVTSKLINGFLVVKINKIKTEN